MHYLVFTLVLKTTVKLKRTKNETKSLPAVITPKGKTFILFLGFKHVRCII